MKPLGDKPDAADAPHLDGHADYRQAAGGGMGDGRREPRQVEPAAALVAEFGADYADAFGVASPATATALAARSLTAAHHSLG